MSLLELFVEVDDFVQKFESWAAQQQLLGKAKRGPKASLSVSEVMTVVIHFHQEGYRDFKHYYQKHVCKRLAAEFPGLVSYGRFIELMKGVLLPLCAYLQSRFGRCTGTAFVDSTPLAVCHNRRINRHKVFQDLAARGKTSISGGWIPRRLRRCLVTLLRSSEVEAEVTVNMSIPRPLAAGFFIGLVLWLQTALDRQRTG